MASNPYGITQVDVPAMLGMHQQLRTQRLDELYKAKEMARQDKEDARSDALDAAYAKAFGGGSSATPATPPAAETAPVAPPTTAPATPPQPITDAEAGPILHQASVSKSIAAADAERVRNSLGPNGQAHFDDWMKQNGIAIAQETPPQDVTPQPTPGLHLNQEGLRALMAAGPKGAEMATALMKLNSEQIKSAQEGMTKMMEMKGRIINGVRALPPEQRKGQYQKERTQLITNGADPNSLPLDWDEHRADMMIQQSMDVAAALGMEDKARSFAETVRHNRVTEAQGEARIGVAQGALGLAKERASKTGSSDTSTVSTGDLLRAAGL